MLWLPGRTRAPAIQSVGRGVRDGAPHGALRRARRHPGERRRLCAAAPGFPVPAARNLLPAGRRTVAHLCAGGPAMTDAPSTFMETSSARYWRAPLAWVGRGVRARLRFLLALMALSAGIVAEALLPRS